MHRRYEITDVASAGVCKAADQILRWLCLGAAGVVMFLSVTNIITYEVAPVPLLWVIPLGIYLMAFVLNFKKNPWCPSWIVRYIGPIIGLTGDDVFLVPKTYFAGPCCHWVAVWFFIFYMHVYPASIDFQSKPSSNRQMTLFYVMISLGGFLGGISDQLDHSAYY